jgi:N-methylhydantoinase A
MSRMIGVDVGGTFTDVFVLDEDAARLRSPRCPRRGPTSRAVSSTASAAVDDLSTVDVVVHGTTAGTNALLERKGARIGVITTAGLRDVLEMRRRDRPRTWGLRGDFEPVVPRDLRLEVPERTLADGTIHTPVDLDAVRAAARHLIDAGCAAVAILFANAYANPENEARAVEAVRALWPNPHVSSRRKSCPKSASSSVSRRPR